MKREKNLTYIFRTLVLALLLSHGSVLAQTTYSDISSKKLDVELTNSTMLELINELARRDVPIGLERASDYRDKIAQKMYEKNGRTEWKAGTIDIKSGTVKEVLDSLVAQEPQYHWEIVDGVVNIFPAESRDDLLRMFLEMKIEEFVPEQVINKFQLRDSFVELPEIKEFLKKRNLEILKRYYPSGGDSIQHIKIDISHTTVRSALNNIILSTDNKIWVVERLGENKRFLSLSF